MTERLVRFGYVTVEFTRDCLLGPAGTVMRGHSFHYSEIVGAPDADTSYRVSYSLSGREEAEGFGVVNGNVLGSYVHLNFRAHADVAKHFVAAAMQARNELLVRG